VQVGDRPEVDVHVRRQGFSERAGAFVPEALVRFLIQLRRRRIGAASGAWTQFEEGTTYPVAVAVDGKAFEAVLIESVYGCKVGDLRGAEVTFKEPALLEAVAAGKSLTFMSEGSEMVTVGLDGSAAALEQVGACQATR
jgi:hypothetical protein